MPESLDDTRHPQAPTPTRDDAAPLLLASASPRRADLLRAAGIRFEARPAAIDESVLPGEESEAYVRRAARAKARAIAEMAPSRTVIGADTTVVVGGEILGKPEDREDAARMLRLLSGRTHEVLTGVCLIHPAGGHGAGRDQEAIEVARTLVEFAPLSAAELDWYVASGEPMDKAGAYAIQGPASRYITRIDGCYANVVGLPVSLLYRMCAAAGILVS
jgi:septum formation protein